jgi:hypothetical protein
MAAAPEEFLFVHSDPPSPSVFLDLLPTPPHDDPAAFDDMVLPYIARLLMDEEAIGEDNFFYQYPDHHEPYIDYQIKGATMITNSGQGEKTRRRRPDRGTDREKGLEKRKNEPETRRHRDLLGRRQPWQ